jgi:hypothetical protein
MCVRVLLKFKQNPATLQDKLMYLREAYRFCRSSGMTYELKKQSVYPTAASCAEDFASNCEPGTPVCAKIRLRRREAEKLLELLQKKHGLNVSCKSLACKKKIPGFRLYVFSLIRQDT